MGSDPADGPWWYQNRQRKVRIDNREIQSFLSRLSATLAPGLEFAVVVGSDAALREANRRFRGKSGATDVLSFPDDEKGRLGDILISARRAAAQSQERGHRPEDEIKILILHGLLHLLGYDHEQDKGEMRAEEARLRRVYDLAPGLIERTEPCGLPQ